ncbi:hypothetical protein E2I00_003338 [Balaenoptera physalus]|uniref:SH3 domain-containing protein n=1 Tax=Balaenoptera physalus TaxID=9770 RepID=A0A643BSD5_BALPH|nr:hypothetical protein E2I00_003338 [Balaenoptera physalus]
MSFNAFDQAVTKDACMAVGFFQRGVANFQLERFLRPQAWPSAQVCIVRIPLQKQVPLQPRQVPRGEVFRPHRRHLAHLEPVVASAVPEGPHGDARPQQPQALYARGEARPGAAERARDTGPSGPGTRCGPRTPLDAEMGVSSGQAGRADRGTLVTSDEQVGEPGQGRQGPQYLEDPRPRLSFGTSHSWTLQGSQGRAGLLVAGGPGPGSSEDPAGAGCTFTLALRAPRGADLSSLRALMSQALPPQAQSGQLRCGDALTPPAVDQAWLEGHCDGRIGIFPKCFVSRPSGAHEELGAKKSVTRRV